MVANTKLIMKLIKHKLLAIAIIISLVFCAELTVMGYTKFVGIASGMEGNYIDFPNNSTIVRINVEFIFLNIVYVFRLIQNFQKPNFIGFSRI